MILCSINICMFYKKITSLQNRQPKQVYKSCGDDIGFFYNVFRSWVHTFSPPKTRPPKKDTECIIFNFSSKALDHINLNSIVRDTRIQSLLPNKIMASTNAPHIVHLFSTVWFAPIYFDICLKRHFCIVELRGDSFPTIHGILFCKLKKLLYFLGRINPI